MIRATDAVAQRQNAVDFLNSPLGNRWITESAARFGDAIGQAGLAGPSVVENMLRSPVLNAARVGELFVISDEMQRIAEAASKTMPRQALLPGDAPATHGMMFWARDPDDCGDVSQVFAWETRSIIVGDEPVQGIVFSLLGRADDKPLAPCGVFPIGFGQEPIADVFGGGNGNTVTWLRTVLAAWTLMQQAFAAVETADLDRAASRRLRRSELASMVRVIRLRGAKGDSSGSEGGRDYQHRWIVRGHWRNQYLPSRGTHRLQWITEHIKGPEGKPLLMGEKVYAWTR